MRRRYWLLLLGGAGLGIGIPLWLGGGALLPRLLSFPPERLLLLLGMIVVAWNFNAGRLRLLSGGMGYRLGQREALAIIMATEFAICATPGGAGGPVTSGWLLHRRGLPMARGLALYAVDQLMDMVFFVTALAGFTLYWLLVPSDLHVGWQLMALAGLLIGGLFGLGVLVRHYRPVLLLAGRLLRRFNVASHTRHRLARWALEFRRSLRLIQAYSPYRLGAVYVLCVGHWLLRYSVLYFAVLGMGGSISWSYAFVVQMLSLTAGQATLLPGGSGGAEVSGSLLLLPYMDAGTAAASVLVWRFVTFYWYLIAGAPVFAVLAGRPLWQRLSSDRPMPLP